MKSVETKHISLTEPTSAEMVRLWLAYAKEKYSKTTFGHHRASIKRFKAFMPTNIKYLSVQDIDDYTNALKDKSEVTIRKHLYRIRAFIRYLCEYHDFNNPNIEARLCIRRKEDQSTISSRQYCSPEPTTDKGISAVELRKRETIRSWLAYVKRRLSLNTYKSYKSTIWNFYKHIKDIEFTDLTPRHVEDYLSLLQNKSNKTFNCHLACLKSFFRYASDYNGLPNPAVKIKMLSVTNEPQRILDENEYDAVLNVCTPTEKLIIQILGCTGLRANELLSLVPSNISEDKKFLNINGKGNKPRTVPINDVCREHFDRVSTFRLLESTNYLKLLRICHRLAKRVNIPDFTPHALRRFFATRLIDKGADIYKVSKTLGHSSVKVTEKIYVYFREKQIAGLTDILDR